MQKTDIITVEWPGSDELGIPFTWNEFLEHNAPGMEPEELAEIAEALDTEGEYHGGGGAAAEYILKVGE